jgi:hypothetical protein
MSARRSKVVNIRSHLKAARIRASKNLDVEGRYLVSRLPEPVARAIMLAAIKSSVKPLLKLPPEWRFRAISAYETAIAQSRRTASVLAFPYPADRQT